MIPQSIFAIGTFILFLSGVTFIMENTITINKSEFEEIIGNIVEKSVVKALNKKKLFFRKIFLETLEDIGLAKAIDEGLKSKTIDKNDFMNKLNNMIQE